MSHRCRWEGSFSATRLRRFATSVVLAVLLLQCACAQSQVRKLKPLLRDFIGLNVHTVQFKPELYQPVTRRLRDYHPFDWDVGNETDFYPRFPFARNQVDWEGLYGAWKKAGYSTSACVMFDSILPTAWKDLERDAWAYGFQFARFFGPSGRQKLVEAVEIGNEPGKYDDASYRKLFENAARGIRQGDPKLLIATCAVYARASGPYHKDIATVKGLEALYDVLNVHSYPELEPYPTWRRSFPEDPRLKFLTDIRDVIAWRDANAPGKQVWLTEFGWDATTKPQAKEGDFKQWVGVTDTQQAQYIVRAFLVLAEMDLDRAYLFWFNDDDKPSIHGSSGLTRSYQSKPSFYAVAHLLATLGDYRFARTVVKKPELYVYQFEHGSDAGKRVWAVWSPTGEGKSTKTRLRVPEGWKVTRGERVPLKSGPAEAVRWDGDAEWVVEVDAAESPVYLWLQQTARSRNLPSSSP